MRFYTVLRDSFVLLSTYTIAFWSTFYISNYWFDSPKASYLFLLVAYIAGFLIVNFLKNVKFLKILFATYAIFCIGNIFYRWVNFQQYGDYSSWYTILATETPISEWFLGTKIVIWFYQLILFFIPPSSFLLSNLAKILGIIWMFSWTYYFLKPPIKYRNLLVVISPLWLLFMSGYSEYYPFIIPLYLWLLNIIFCETKEYLKKHWLELSCLIGILPLIYIGFLPFSIYIFIALLYLNRKYAIQIFALPILIGATAVVLLYPGNSMYMYLAELNSHFNWGDKNTSFPRYIGKAASTHSITFSLDYVLSAVHQYDTIFHLWFGGSMLALLFLIKWIRRLISTIYMKLRYSDNPYLVVQACLAIIIFSSHVYYLYFLIPKLGPHRDIDLFFNTHLIFAYTLGYIFDLYPPKPYLIAAIVGYNLIITSYLLLLGIPYIN